MLSDKTNGQPQDQSKTFSLRPLLLAEEMFPALERCVLEAQTEILFSFRIFDPSTTLRSNEAKALQLDTWQDLLQRKANEGLHLRVFLTDFEPILTPDLHGNAWRNVSGFLDIIKSAPEADLQIVCAQHDARFSRAVEWVFWPMLLQKLWKVKKQIASGDLDMAYLPGLKTYFGDGGALNPAKLVSPTEMHPVTHHQKFCVIDGSTAIIGGLDVDERRYDDRRRDRPARETWQDMSVQLRGEIANELRARFAQWWNHDCNRAAPRERLEDVAAALGVQTRKPTPLKAKPSAKSDRQTHNVIATRTRDQDGFWTLRPKPVDLSILDKTFEIIRSAKSCVYIETQFLRHLPIAEALATAAQNNTELQCIILLPFAPEEVAFAKQRNGAHRLGEHLQVKCLDKIQAAFGHRAGVFGLVKNAPAQQEAGRAKAYGSGVIHVHSKALIVDDAHYTVTSANLNGRSLVWDTELGVSGEDPEMAFQLRSQLWRLHSGSDEFGGQALAGAVDAWRTLAQSNAAAEASDRQGFIVPYKKMPARRFGAPTFYIPNDMV